jgi:hypothetical protein
VPILRLLRVDLNFKLGKELNQTIDWDLSRFSGFDPTIAQSYSDRHLILKQLCDNLGTSSSTFTFLVNSTQKSHLLIICSTETETSGNARG